jgi:hypothetical protein
MSTFRRSWISVWGRCAVAQNLDGDPLARPGVSAHAALTGHEGHARDDHACHEDPESTHPLLLPAHTTRKRW